MDLSGILSELRSERERIEHAIITLERLNTAHGARLGPSAKLPNNGAGTEIASKKRRFSAEARRRMAEAQRKRWAAARKASGA